MKVTLYRGDRKEDAAKMVSNSEFVYTNYNLGGYKKNDANFYFLTDTIEYASEYNTEVITEWKADGNFLDLTTLEGKKQVAHLFNHEYEKALSAMKAAFAMPSIIRKKTKKQINDEQAMIQQLQSTTPCDFLLDANWFWHQDISDFMNGIILKKWLVENNYDGFIAKESNNGLTYGLIKRPTFIKSL
jgi:hypothetical protein